MALGRLERQLEVVERRQQLLGEPGRPALGRLRVLARHPLAVVLEVRLRALGEREELGGVVLDCGGRLDLAGGRRLGVGERRLARARRIRVGRRRRGELLVLRGAVLWPGARLVGHHFCSSTTSASTTSSSDDSADAPLPEPSADAPAAACSAWARSYICSETLWNAVCRRSVFARMSSVSSDSSTPRTSLIASSISRLEASSSCSPRSLTCFSAWYAAFSALLRASASSRRRLSSSACDSASDTMRLISSSESPEPALISIFCSLPVPRSFAEK